MSTGTRNKRVGFGAGAGAAAYLVGYLFVYVLQRPSIDDQLQTFGFILELFGEEPIPSWRAVGWVFYSAHYVFTEVPGLGGGRTVNFLLESDDGSLTALFLVPPLLLLVGGFVLAWTLETDRLDPVEGATQGVTLVAGYLPLAVVGLFVFRHTVAGTTIGPDPVTAVLLAGILYPTLFGAIGGALGAVVRSQ